jgi:hypothetical protein
MAITNAHTEWETLTAHAEAQEHLLELIAPIFTVPIGRPRRDRSSVRAGLFLVGPIQGHRRRILMKPWSREGIDLQGVKRDRTEYAVEICGKQRIQELPQPVIME